MKKSVVLSIAVIYIIAIIVVGFLGQALKVYNENIYVESISCISDDFVEYNTNSEDYKNGYIGYIQPDKYEEGLKVLIKCRVEPANATHKVLEYISSDESTCVIQTQEDGTAIATFLKAGTVTVIIKSTDNGDAQVKIKIITHDVGGIL